ncbi:hypothetical protein EJ05DRAFT_539696 [Pseudovirgaria hyperparasitica]|uniref:Uncharacterized protein n=1 Tax=Pseudovirgaria hyperparasitica TaxID=470096 RepID=A0A6A6W2L9_9PEZI|nr:uncharacterized protein EJ05DRAFT_539696 [Pseudovirgaria hyperparasitica]KAF2755837.1 hypothetical protein EJ05DRAFT_539696 [Pseudovirgaria hyperparasitica]
MSTVIAELENYSIYIILSLRGAEHGFHWGIFVPTEKPAGEVWHAVNRSGGWSLEQKTTTGVPYSQSLCLVFKVGVVSSQTWTTLRTTLGNVPSVGQPSRNTGEAFTCRVWVKDALLALHNANVIQLVQAIATIESNAIREAEGRRSDIEHGTKKALIKNRSGASTMS